MPKDYLMSASIGTPKRDDKDWLLTPASAAEHLGRGAWKRYNHVDFIADRIATIRDHPLFLIVTIPPRHGKSELISHWTPVWYLKNWPYKKVIMCSYQAGFAVEWGGATKNTMSENTPELGLELMQDTKAKANWRIKGYGGGMTATGIGGPLTGRGGDLIIIDDPIKSQREALSETYRASAREWYKATLRTRLQPGGSLIILMTRWHEEDLAGWLLEAGEEDLPYQDPWEVINLPAIAEEDDPLGRPVGAALCPEMYDIDSLYTLRESVGPYWFSAEYQGHPRPEGGSIIKEGWFGYFTEDENPLFNDKIKIQRLIESWDTAFEKGNETSRTACAVLAETKDFYYVLDIYADRIEFPELVDVTKSKYSQYIPDRVFIEHKASGHSLIQQLRRDTKIPIVPVKASTDKVARVHAISGTVEAGRVKLPARAPWLSEFLHEVCSFPSAKHDDITDAFAHGLMQLRPSAIRTKRSDIRRNKKKPWWKD